jgi:hypothetical protein
MCFVTLFLQQVTSCGLTAQQAKLHVASVCVTNQGAQLSFWPPALCTFTGLSSLNLSGNAVTFIPESIQALTGLKVPLARLLAGSQSFASFS